jgi:hypothetical protein
VYEYDLSGKYINTIRVTSDYLRAVHEFVSLDENTTVFFAAFHHPFRIVYYDLTKKEIKAEAYEENDVLGSMLNYSSFYFYKGDWYFYRPFDLHVYKVGKNNSEAAYTWDFGKYNRDVKKAHFSNQAQNDPYKSYEEISEQFPYWLAEMGENNRYMIAHVKLNGEFINVFFDKTVQQGLFIKQFTESVIICPYIVTNEYVLSYCNPGELEKYITEGMLDESNRKIFNELIHEDANPIILKYNFK